MGRPSVRLEVQRDFWREVARGTSVVDAAGCVGVSRPVGQRWFAASGGVVPSFARTDASNSPSNGQPSNGSGGEAASGQGSYRRLTFEERHEIAALKKARNGVQSIARQLGRSASTVSRELARHGKADGGYVATSAQSNAEKTAQQKGRRANPAKLATDLRLRGEVQDRLEAKHSPEQIARRLRRDYPDEPEMWVSHETIYQSIYVQGRGGLKRELAQQLRTGRALRKPRRQAQQRTQRGDRIKDKVMIADRPPEATDRSVPGHWEGDMILGSTASNSAIGTLVEKATGYTVLVHLPDGHGALAFQQALVRAVADLPATLRRTLTWDQGIEMTNHAAIAEATGLEVYFCDPHSPWQRPSNENTNGLLRQYFPKGTDLSFWGPGVLERVAIELNNRPRKRLDWATPAEALDQLLSQQDNDDGVALGP